MFWPETMKVTFHLIENHKVLTHSMSEIGQSRPTINLPKAEKKTTEFTMKSILRDCTGIVWSPGSDGEPQEANLAWNSGNTAQIHQIWCKIGCRSAFLVVSIEFNTEFQCWINFWRFGALNVSHALYHALTYQQSDFQRIWDHLFFRGLGDLS